MSNKFDTLIDFVLVLVVVVCVGLTMGTMIRSSKLASTGIAKTITGTK